MVIHQHDGSVEFAYFRPAAQQVTLVGDFNNWQPGELPLERDERGWWRVRLALGPGEYRFKYQVDGKIWEADFAAYGVENDKHGGWNSVLWVQETEATLELVDAGADLRIAA